jgi:hypothetical protein
VSSTKNQTLTVKYFKDGKPKELISGKYADIKGDLAKHGIKYNKVIYIMVIDCDELEVGTIAKILLKGAGAAAWFDVKEKQNVVVFDGFEDGLKGAVRYRYPRFAVEVIETGDAEEAETAYEQVKEYFSTQAHTAPVHPVVEEEDEDSMPF